MRAASRSDNVNFEDIRAGDRRALSRFLTLVENSRDVVAEELAELSRRADDHQIIGVTGPPGSGKSTLIAALTKLYREVGRTVAIVAVDPSSPFTGGALLGDRIRLKALAGDKGVFIRSMASRGSLGGLAWRTQDVVRVLAAAGFNIVIVETVGAGQTEVDIAGLSPTTVVVQAPGAGDDVQANKAGLLEIADILVVNKSDLPGAERAKNALKAMLDLGHPTKAKAQDQPIWVPPIVLTSAIEERGINDLAECIASQFSYMQKHGLLVAFQEAQLRAEFMHRLRETLQRRLFDTFTAEEFAGIIRRMVQERIEPQRAVDQLLQNVEFRRRK
ncbi:MAG: methylmalonyl Co-A mutase-associated GTPase MeaB [Chloroflexi bacterium]|nr:methylmalonyl Co-A mutase-associated GTPase MeaB [Chloroflexota bacterium]